MIEARDAIAKGRSLKGTPYGDDKGELLCDKLIIKIIQTAPGGKPDYTTAHTVELWNSINVSAKYRDLTWRSESIKDARAGHLAFKRYNKPADHVGLVTERGTVIHASSEYGEVVETPLTADDGWNGLGTHRYIKVAEEEEESMSYLYSAQVTLKDKDSKLNVRKAPSGDVIGKIGHGAVVQVYAEKGEWAFVRYGESGSGYVSVKYLAPYTEPEKPAQKTTALIREDGARLELVGVWRLAGD